MDRFRDDNTEGYSTADLAELNRRYAAGLAACAPEDRAEKSVQDHVAERVAAEFDREG